MSGGHFDYIQSKMEYTLSGQFRDPELNALFTDLLKLIDELDLWLEGDAVEEDWDKARDGFKRKWLRGNDTERLKGLVGKEIEKLRNELIKMIECGTSEG